MFSEITLTNAMRAMFTLTGLILVMLVFSGPAGFVGLPMILLPALSGIMVGIARALESGDMVRFWFTVASLPFAVASAIVYAWSAQDATATRLFGWVQTWDSFYVSPLTVTLAYAALATLMALSICALAWLTLVSYREVRPLLTHA